MVAILVIVVAWGLTLVLYPRLPERIPIHWNIRGEIDGYGPKAMAFVLPGLMVGLMLMFGALPWLLPPQLEIDSFRSTYSFLIILILAFFLHMHSLSLWVALGHPLNFNRGLLLGCFLLLILMGNVLGKVRRNFLIGVRTPWTLASNRVWTDTHRLAAHLFVGGGCLGLLIELTGLPLVLVFVPLGIAVVVPIVYSLVHYKRLERRGML
jgi:uncharacterized membrane protein